MLRWIALIISVLLLTVIAHAQDANARIINMWETLNMRSVPSDDGEVVIELTGRTPVFVSGRTRDNAWYQVRTDAGVTGWVASGFVELRTVEQSAIPIIFEPAAAPAESAPVEVAPPQDTTSSGEAVAPAALVEVSSDAPTNARITAAALNVRATPSTDGALLTRLSINTRILVIGRSSDNAWYQAQLNDGSVGWLAAAFVAAEIEGDSLPIVDGSVPVAEAPAPQVETVADAADATVPEAPSEPPPPNGYLAIGANTWSIFANGQAMGNQATVFSKIGDSITVDPSVFTPIGYGNYNLGGFGYLQATINFFSTPTATGANSFAGVSMAANSGWTTATVLNPANANPDLCASGESPIQCEYRLNRPAVALIMFGSNDVVAVDAVNYAQNMRTITDFSIAQGVIPVLSTIPPRRGFEDRTTFYNQLVRDTAAQFGVPLWDYHAAMLPLPNNGLSDDGLHPSAPRDRTINGATFTDDYLGYGYVIRNLTALQVLDTLRREVLSQ